ncbi:hypothetical protein ACHAXA_001678 [Cyclostephanos tholiformis]|uniref:Thioredoxin domain-containing protein n=1 Tax=Cyclostephanos tholiformis TaxID=382380 RepID=A0ABD3RS72_9STRA
MTRPPPPTLLLPRSIIIVILLLPPLLLLLLPNSSIIFVRGDALDDLWNSYVKAQRKSSSSSSSSSSYESTVSRRERNLDHWDVSAASAHLGLHPETLMPLPSHIPPSSIEGSSSPMTSAVGVPPTDDGIHSDDAEASAIDEYIGHDAAILFYSQRSAECHAVAPSWDAIATHLNAGSRTSGLVMALFDCERNAIHAKLCDVAGIKYYPTIMYVGSGEYHGAERGLLGLGGGGRSTPPRRTVVFRGDWRYADQILDWINVMGALSSWHAINEGGPMRVLRNGLFRLLGWGGTSSSSSGKRGGKGVGESLPVGVPPGFQAHLRGDGSSSITAAAYDRKVRDLEARLNATIKEKGLYERANTHSGYLLEGLLFPGKVGGGMELNDDGPPRRDPFAILTESDGWYKNATSHSIGSPNDEHPLILRSCVLELVVDYCTRVTNRVTNDYIKELSAIPESDPFPTLDEIESHLLDEVGKREPYCGLIETCVLTDFVGTNATGGIGCRPPKCPFVNDAACSYVECCLDPNVQDEYGIALGLIEEGERVSDKDWDHGSGKSKGDGTSGGNTANVGGWGVPVK